MIGPNFFAVTTSIPIDAQEFDLPAVTATFYLVEFTVKNLENPNTDPIGAYFYAGIRRYLWRDKFWAEYEAPVSLLTEKVATKLRDCRDHEEAITLRRLLDLLKSYGRSTGLTDQDMVDNTAKKVFQRVIYEIKEG
jgi:hypothetical protein